MPQDGEIRENYGYDPTLRATVLPSAKQGPGMGGSMGFDHESPNIKQNIVICEDNQMKTIAVVDRAAMARAPKTKKQPTSAEVEQAFLTAVNKQPTAEETKQSEEVLESTLKPTAEQELKGLQALIERQAAKLEVERLRAQLRELEIPTRQRNVEPQRVPEPTLDEDPIPAEFREGSSLIYDKDDPGISTPHPSLPGRGEAMMEKVPAPKTIQVSIKGPFGRVRQHYSSVFRDGNQLILMTKHRDIPSSYELPEIEDSAMMVEVQVNDKLLDCVWAGIQFTMPDNSVTFTVLLIAEEHEDAEV